ncbi:unnamed protein product [Cuscuta campestris]|uniref:Myosin motor domain-containing protein n=1 Tax=Cuscuta campestris TaxID=132261 RepID=A0A484NAZ9_9ASTE|nr:unnamed protein product [Cuscuta campestris]
MERSADRFNVHSGFLSAYDSVRTKLISLIKQAVGYVDDDLEPTPKWYVYVTGHSLGGALATLLALELSTSQLTKHGGCISVTVYNFGSPRVGNKKFAELYNKANVEPLEDSYQVDVIGEATPDVIMKGEKEFIEKILNTEINFFRAIRDGSALMQHMEDFYYITLLEVVTKASNVYPKDTDAPSCGTDDMTKLSYLHEPGVLYNLRCRYDNDEIYTYTGNILIAVNPFKRLLELYGKCVMEKYIGTALGELSPHPFAIADAAYRQAVMQGFMINDRISQSILVSGESGAGKTESTKMLMNYLAYMGGRTAYEGWSMEQQVLESNPVLEAFGNAKTDVEKYKLGNPRKFHYLNQSKFFELDEVDESKEYLATRVVAAILLLGNIEFVKGSEPDSAEPKDD